MIQATFTSLTTPEPHAGLEEYIYEWNEAAETYMRALRRMVEEELGVSMDSYVDAPENESNPGDVSDAH